MRPLVDSTPVSAPPSLNNRSLSIARPDESEVKVVAVEVRLALEFCDGGSLRDLLDTGSGLKTPEGDVNYTAVSHI